MTKGMTNGFTFQGREYCNVVNDDGSYVLLSDISDTEIKVSVRLNKGDGVEVLFTATNEPGENNLRAFYKSLDHYKWLTYQQLGKLQSFIGALEYTVLFEQACAKKFSEVTGKDWAAFKDRMEGVLEECTRSASGSGAVSLSAADLSGHSGSLDIEGIVKGTLYVGDRKSKCYMFVGDFIGELKEAMKEIQIRKDSMVFAVSVESVILLKHPFLSSAAILQWVPQSNQPLSSERHFRWLTQLGLDYSSWYEYHDGLNNASAQRS